MLYSAILTTFYKADNYNSFVLVINCLFLRDRSGWSWVEDLEADTRKIDVEPEVWDAFFTDPASKKKYG